jgi:hypothetical protein
MADMTALEWRISELKKQYPSWRDERIKKKDGLYYYHHDIMNTFEGQRAKLLCYSFCSTIGGVYFITDYLRALTKIGMSVNIAKRFIQHMETAGHPLFLQGFIPCGAVQMRAIERMCHLIFKDLNTRKDNTLHEFFYNREGENGYPNPENAAKIIMATFTGSGVYHVDCDAAFWNIVEEEMRPIFHAHEEDVETFVEKYGGLSSSMIRSLYLDGDSRCEEGWGE